MVPGYCIEEMPIVNVGIVLEKRVAPAEHLSQTGGRSVGVDACAVIQDLFRGTAQSRSDFINVAAVNSGHSIVFHRLWFSDQ